MILYHLLFLKFELHHFLSLTLLVIVPVNILVGEVNVKLRRLDIVLHDETMTLVVVFIDVFELASFMQVRLIYVHG